MDNSFVLQKYSDYYWGLYARNKLKLNGLCFRKIAKENCILRAEEISNFRENGYCETASLTPL